MANSARRPHSAHWGAFYPVVENGKFVGVEPFPSDPAPSPILNAMPEMVDGRARVRQPAIRRGWMENGRGRATDKRGADEYVLVSWADALDLLSQELLRVRETCGNEAIFAGSYGWCSAGRFHHAKSHLQRFMNLFGGAVGQINSYSFAAAQALLPHVIGTLDPLTGPLSSYDGILENTRMMVMFGGAPAKNMQVESGGAGEHMGSVWLRRCSEASIRMVSVSPIRDDVDTSLGAQWLPIRPNTDTALILALCHVLVTEELHDADFLAKYCVGFERFESYVLGKADNIAKTPEWAEAISGVPARQIYDLARAMVRSRTMITMAWSLQRADHGEQPYWAAIALAAMLGQIGLPGGGFGFGYGAEANLGNPLQLMDLPTFPTGSSPLPTRIPVARIADMLLEPGREYEFNGTKASYPDIKLVYWAGGNPFHHHQDINKLVRAFHRPDTIVVNECWWTATARHADIVLPVTTTLERNDIGAARRDRFLIAMHKAVSPVGDARTDFEIFAALAVRCGFGSAYDEGRDEMRWLHHMYRTAQHQNGPRGIDFPDFDQFWSEGHVEVPMPSRPYTAFEDFRDDPVAHPLRTPSGRIELFSSRISGFDYEDCPGHPVWIPPCEYLGAPLAQKFPLHLLSNQPKTRLHSQMDAAGPSLESKILGREPMRMHPADAARRGIADGQIVRVWNDRGSVFAGSVLSEDVMPGVVELATGAWYDPAQPFGPCLHGNPNVLTEDKGTSRLAQGPVAHSCLVDIEPWFWDLPAVTVHDGVKAALPERPAED
ncbi:molybdopterin-dependent oxidoreductase [Stappia sp. ES.058]|uniref:molybdopterin-dependent oxidoreductase n=1 Tax=Stappia sp. ES.058 TaxID=1881061 RepID=UPI000B895D15|nr:molybdopterin-dependent oxidoreductase [Stappia sp. ES.058]